MRAQRKARLTTVAIALAATFLGTMAVPTTAASSDDPTARVDLAPAVAMDTSSQLRALATGAVGDPAALANIPDERGAPGVPTPTDTGFTGDAAAAGAASTSARAADVTPAAISAPMTSFEGISNQDNFTLYGGRVNPPDPVGDVGPDHYVEMVNLAFAVYDKAGNRLLGPAPIGSLWTGFSVDDCTDASGDPIVVYDQFADRWILSQFTTAGPEYFNCIAISTSGDPTGTYHRYAFSTGLNFPDYPKYGVWTDTYVITTREFGPTGEYGIGVYALEKNRMVNGQPNARVASFFLDGNATGMLPLVGDGLLPADIDGRTRPKSGTAIPIVGTQDDGAPYGATFDAANVWDLRVKWRAAEQATLTLATRLPVAAYDSIFPCAPTSRDCLPQPGINSPTQYLDILSYRQRPTWRLAYRAFKGYESLVTNQSVEAAPGVAGVRWYELRRDAAGAYAVYQQGTYAPADGVHRWMGSIAQDKHGGLALGYSVVNGVDVFPGIRYTGRLAGDPLGQMTQGEQVGMAGTGVQTTMNSRWGDYTSMNVDPVDDCTFWYVNEYYTAAGQASSSAGWQTRVISFRLPGC